MSSQKQRTHAPTGAPLELMLDPELLPAGGGDSAATSSSEKSASDGVLPAEDDEEVDPDVELDSVVHVPDERQSPTMQVRVDPLKSAQHGAPGLPQCAHKPPTQRLWPGNMHVPPSGCEESGQQGEHALKPQEDPSASCSVAAVSATI